MRTDEEARAEFSRRAVGDYRRIRLDHGAFSGRSDHPVTPEFYRFFETIAAQGGMMAPTDAEKNQLQAASLDVKLTPRVRDAYRAFLAKFIGQTYKPQFVCTAEWLEDAHFQDAWYRLSSREISFELKLNAMESRIDDMVAGLRALDKRDYETMKRVFD